jgi:hypothetical protein
MKFIFPKNYRYTSKILGFIDYVTAIVDLTIGIILFLIIKLLFRKISIQIYFFVILYLPFILFTIFLVKEENIVDFVSCIIKFIKKRGVYVYEKEDKIDKR